jgi:NAD(P)H-hydrate epimerase
VESVLELYDGPLVLDADGLNIIAKPELGFLDKLKGRTGQTVITPHPGEAERLSRCSQVLEGKGQAIGRPDLGDSSRNRKLWAMALAERTGATVVLKGAATVVATQGKTTYINTTGNPGMATGGAGDVLTGVIAGLWGQKQTAGRSGALRRRISGEEAAVAGVFLHGLAGDLAAKRLGEYGLIAGDIAEAMPFAIKQILKG